MDVTPTVILTVVLIALVLAVCAEYYRARQMERTVGQPQKLSLVNIVVAALVLGGVVFTVLLFACGRENDPKRYVNRGEPDF
jgi:hypothetical protein